MCIYWIKVYCRTLLFELLTSYIICSYSQLIQIDWLTRVHPLLHQLWFLLVTSLYKQWEWHYLENIRLSTNQSLVLCHKIWNWPIRGQRMLFFLCLVIFVSSSWVECVCKPGWQNWGGRCYFMSSAAKNWWGMEFHILYQVSQKKVPFSNLISLLKGTFFWDTWYLLGFSFSLNYKCSNVLRAGIITINYACRHTNLPQDGKFV